MKKNIITVRTTSILSETYSNNNFSTYQGYANYTLNNVRKILKNADSVELFNYNEEKQASVRLHNFDCGIHELKLILCANACIKELKEQNIKPCLFVEAHNMERKKIYSFTYYGYLKALKQEKVEKQELAQQQKLEQDEENAEK